MDASDLTGKSKSLKNNVIKKRLLTWFLLLSLVPLLLVTLYNFHQTKTALIETASADLEHSAALSRTFIRQWFYERETDIQHQAKLQTNITFLESLSTAFKVSDEQLGDYLESHQYEQLIASTHQEISSFASNRDYIYDALLIDIDGNILFSTTENTDLGTNLINGPYAKSKFAQAFQRASSTNSIVFSDLERYLPSKQDFSAFLLQPILNETGQGIGVFAIQLKLGSLFKILLSTATDERFYHYIVGEDGYLRTPIDGKNWSGVLSEKITTEQYQRWYEEHGPEGTFDENQAEIVFEYIGPQNQSVYGMHSSVELFGTKWVLLSEADSQYVLSPVSMLGQTLLGLLIIIILIIVYVATFQAKRITQPIDSLVRGLQGVSQGDFNQKLTVEADDEVGRLMNAFNEMIEIRQKFYQELNNKTEQAETALKKLAEQQYALDQHASVTVTDLSGTILYANEKFSKLSGFSREELIGNNHRILNSSYHNDEFYHEMFQTIMQGDVWHGEVCNKNKSGNLYWVDSTILPFLDDNGEPRSYIGIRTDITEKKQNEIKLQDAVSDLKEKQDLLEQEEKIAQHVFANITASHNDEIAEVASWCKPMGAFSGDMVLSTVLENGGIRVVLCDFTGHGLPAALGAVPVSSIYTAITAKNLPLEILMTELNDKLKTLLPTGIFCCIAGVDINSDRNVAQIWNSGIPKVLFVSKEGEIKQRFSSAHLPLGVRTYKQEEMQTVEIQLERGDSLYIYSDGLTEVENIEGEMFGQERFEQLFATEINKNGRLENIKQAVKTFSNGAEPTDDISLIEIKTLVT